MILTIAIMVILTIAIAAFVLAPRMFETRIIYEQVPDRPASFGYKMAWLAIRSRNTDAVLDALNLASAMPCNWKSGIGTVYDHHLETTTSSSRRPSTDGRSSSVSHCLIPPAAALPTKPSRFSAVLAKSSSRSNTSSPTRPSTFLPGRAS